ncbi:MAG: EAL domain-containing protein, partial [Comamonas sp.]|nr:EAL domain-containing protein [Comamonas sp.]
HVGNGKLKLEITESTLQENLQQSIQKMRALLEQGVVFAIDDFGTGYSSLSLLRNLPIQILKIDRSFVRQIDHDQKDAAIARSIVSLAHSMGLQVIAEGVETEEQYMALKALGCQMFQGYLFGRPQPLDCVQEN